MLKHQLHEPVPVEQLRPEVPASVAAAWPQRVENDLLVKEVEALLADRK